MVRGKSKMIEIMPIVSGILFCSVFVWFYLCHRLFKILETRHPEKYESMGKPSLIMNNNLKSNKSFMKFLFGKEWQQFNDDGLTALSKCMLYFFVFYAFGFFLCILAFFSRLAP